MATLYWHNKNGTNNANDRTNYTTDIGGTTAAGAGSLAADSLRFDGSGAGSDDNWTLTADLAVQSLTFTGYVGTATDAGFILTVNTAGTTLFVAGMTVVFTGIFDITAASHTLTSAGKQLHRLRLSTTGTVTLSDAADIDELIINALSGTQSGVVTLTIRSGKITRIDTAGTEATYTINANVVLGASADWQIDGATPGIINLVGTLSGSFDINKKGTGTFRYSNTNNSTHVNTTATGGIIEWYVPASGTKQFGSGTITLAGGEFGFRGNASATFTLTNAIDVSASGGTIRTDRQSANNPTHTLSGTISLSGVLTVIRQGGSGATNYTGALTIVAGSGTRRIVATNTGGSQINFSGIIQDGVGNANGLEVQNNHGSTDVNLRLVGNNTFVNGLTVLTPLSGTSGISNATSANSLGRGDVTIQTGSTCTLTTTTTIWGTFTAQGTAVFSGNQTVNFNGSMILASASTYSQGNTFWMPTVSPVTVDPQGKSMGTCGWGLGSAGDKTINLVSGFIFPGQFRAQCANLVGISTLDCGAGTFTVQGTGTGANPGLRQPSGTRNANEFFTIKFGNTTWITTSRWLAEQTGYINHDYTGATIRFVGTAGSSGHSIRLANTSTTIKRLEIVFQVGQVNSGVTIGSNIARIVTITEAFLLQNQSATNFNASFGDSIAIANGATVDIGAQNTGTWTLNSSVDIDIQGDVVISGNGQTIFSAGSSLIFSGTSVMNLSIAGSGTKTLTGLAITHSGSGRVEQSGDVSGVASFTSNPGAGIWDLNGNDLTTIGAMVLSDNWFDGVGGATIGADSITFGNLSLFGSSTWFLSVTGASPIYSGSGIITNCTATTQTIDATIGATDGGGNTNILFAEIASGLSFGFVF